MIRRLTDHLIDHAARVMPPGHRPWVRAMRAELHHIPGPLAAALFALGCVRASYTQRLIDMLTLARMTRWALAILAALWAGFFGLVATLAMSVKSNPNIKPSDLGRGVDAHNEETLRFIQNYPAWELIGLLITALLVLAGAVQLARRRAHAWPLLAIGVASAAMLALYDRRLPDPTYNRPLDSLEFLAFSLACLVPVWWLSRRAPDLHPAH